VTGVDGVAADAFMKPPLRAVGLRTGRKRFALLHARAALSSFPDAAVSTGQQRNAAGLRLREIETRAQVAFLSTTRSPVRPFRRPWKATEATRLGARECRRGCWPLAFDHPVAQSREAKKTDRMIPSRAKRTSSSGIVFGQRAVSNHSSSDGGGCSGIVMGAKDCQSC
jgi:hypothetical protein